MRYKKVKGGIVLVGKCESIYFKAIPCSVCKKQYKKNCICLRLWHGKEPDIEEEVQSKVIKPVKRR